MSQGKIFRQDEAIGSPAEAECEQDQLPTVEPVLPSQSEADQAVKVHQQLDEASQWQQAYDENYACFYYYRESTQVRLNEHFCYSLVCQLLTEQHCKDFCTSHCQQSAKIFA